MKRFSFKIFLLAICLIATHHTFAQTHRLHDDYSGWSRIIPTHLKGQFAGGMGLLSVGAGWDYGKTNQWETELHVGFLPAKYADKFHAIFTLKQNYIPWDVTLSRSFSLEPLSCGFYMNIISGERFWVRQPARYPGSHYYSFSSRLRLHTYVGQRLRWNLNSESTLKSISLYYELSANDLNIISKVTNKELALSDIVFFSIGVRFQLQR